MERTPWSSRNRARRGRRTEGAERPESGVRTSFERRGQARCRSVHEEEDAQHATAHEVDSPRLDDDLTGPAEPPSRHLRTGEESGLQSHAGAPDSSPAICSRSPTLPARRTPVLQTGNVWSAGLQTGTGDRTKLGTCAALESGAPYCRRAGLQSYAGAPDSNPAICSRSPTLPARRTPVRQFEPEQDCATPPERSGLGGEIAALESGAPYCRRACRVGDCRRTGLKLPNWSSARRQVRRAGNAPAGSAPRQAGIEGNAMLARSS